MLDFERVKLDFRAKKPLYLQLIEQLRQQIESGLADSEEQLPPVRSLAEKLRVNFNTVARAYRALDMEGWISTQQGRGTYLTGQPFQQPQAVVASPAPEKPPVQQGDQRIEQLLREAAGSGISAEALLAYLITQSGSREQAIFDRHIGQQMNDLPQSAHRSRWFRTMRHERKTKKIPKRLKFQALTGSMQAKILHAANTPSVKWVRSTRKGNKHRSERK